MSPEGREPGPPLKILKLRARPSPCPYFRILIPRQGAIQMCHFVLCFALFAWIGLGSGLDRKCSADPNHYFYNMFLIIGLGSALDRRSKSSLLYYVSYNSAWIGLGSPIQIITFIICFRQLGLDRPRIADPNHHSCANCRG